MSQRVRYKGMIHRFPDDAPEAEIRAALDRMDQEEIAGKAGKIQAGLATQAKRYPTKAEGGDPDNPSFITGFDREAKKNFNEGIMGRGLDTIGQGVEEVDKFLNAMTPDSVKKIARVALTNPSAPMAYPTGTDEIPYTGMAAIAAPELMESNFMRATVPEKLMQGAGAMRDAYAQPRMLPDVHSALLQSRPTAMMAVKAGAKPIVKGMARGMESMARALNPEATRPLMSREMPPSAGSEYLDQSPVPAAERPPSSYHGGVSPENQRFLDEERAKTAMTDRIDRLKEAVYAARNEEVPRGTIEPSAAPGPYPSNPINDKFLADLRQNQALEERINALRTADYENRPMNNPNPQPAPVTDPSRQLMEAPITVPTSGERIPFDVTRQPEQMTPEKYRAQPPSTSSRRIFEAGPTQIPEATASVTGEPAGYYNRAPIQRGRVFTGQSATGPMIERLRAAMEAKKAAGKPLMTPELYTQRAKAAATIAEALRNLKR